MAQTFVRYIDYGLWNKTCSVCMCNKKRATIEKLKNSNLKSNS